jgi:hypothetical protein
VVRVSSRINAIHFQIVQASTVRTLPPELLDQDHAGCSRPGFLSFTHVPRDTQGNDIYKGANVIPSEKKKSSRTWAEEKGAKTQSTIVSTIVCCVTVTVCVIHTNLRQFSAIFFCNFHTATVFRLSVRSCR